LSDPFSLFRTPSAASNGTHRFHRRTLRQIDLTHPKQIARNRNALRRVSCHMHGLHTLRGGQRTIVLFQSHI
jgi:hypothetical protein